MPKQRVCTLYADDTQISSSADDIDERTENLNHDFKKKLS